MEVCGEVKKDEAINITISFISEVIGDIYSSHILFLSSYFPGIEHVHNK